MSTKCKRRQTWEMMIDRFRPVILGECLSAVRSCPDARVDCEDLVQDALVKLWERRLYLRGVRNAGGCIRRIVRDTVRRSIADTLKFPPTCMHTEGAGDEEPYAAGHRSGAVQSAVL